MPAVRRVMTRTFVKLGATIAYLVSGAAGVLRPGATGRPPWQRSVLDDVAMRRPWNLKVKAARVKARLSRKALEDGVTVVIVNWNTLSVVADVLKAVKRFSPPETKILVVDNGSTDGSAEMLEKLPEVDTMLLHSNAGHGVALDLAVLASTSTVTVTLDSDAIPLRSGWLDLAVEPVRSGRALLAGQRSSRNFVHPIYLAVDTRAFAERRLSFQVHREPGVSEADVRWGVNAWDTGELMTGQLDPSEIVYVERGANPAPDLPGMTVADVVYHHGGVSRTASGQIDVDAIAGWRAACDALGLTFLTESALEET
jgi:hypothetical protein